MSKKDFLVEIGTEELPPKSLFVLAEAFAQGIASGLKNADLAAGAVEWFATPRRLAVRVTALVDQQPTQQIKRSGPAVTAGFDASGQPTKAALGFAASCGVGMEQLEQADGPKGRVLQYTAVKEGAATQSLLPGIVTIALAQLPIAKRMRWGAHEYEFVRPVHWIVMLFGAAVVDAEIMGIRAGKHTRGHRFHAPQSIALTNPSRYVTMLEEKGHVIADVARRRQQIVDKVNALATELGGKAVVDPALLDEVTALVEWPVALAGHFDAQYLELPAEVPIATMQDHQRYFPLRDARGNLMNAFITIANIESRDPNRVRDGNERVVRPRLADAAFFWATDRKQTLASRCELLKTVTFQNKLGSLFAKSERVAILALRVAESTDTDGVLAQRAAQLSKCDLLTLMVGEFPELQGLMGKYYAQHDAEPEAVATAIEEQYWPRFAGDQLPRTPTGVALAIADKLDTIAGIFSIGQKPSGTRDPFGVRRASLGVLRIVLERELDVDLHGFVQTAVALQPVQCPADTVEEIWSYLMERLRAHYLENATTLSITSEMFDAVLACKPTSVVDINIRLVALQSFMTLADAQSLSSANKRIANILRKAPEGLSGAVETQRLLEPAERQLFDQVVSMERAVNPLFVRRDYISALSQLATLRPDVDRFFDSVMVMAEDNEIRTNRLSLLVRLRALFLQVADLSRLPG